MLAARSCISWLAARAGSEVEIPSSAPFVALPSASPSRSAALIRSHWRLTSDAVRTPASPKTCGWRRTILVGSRPGRRRGRTPRPRRPAGRGGRSGATGRRARRPARASRRPRARRRPRRPPRAGGCAATVGLLAIPRQPSGARNRSLMAGIAHGPATAASGASGARYKGAPRSSSPRSAMVVPAAVPNRPTGWSAGYARARTSSGRRPRGPCRPGRSVGVRVRSVGLCARQEHGKRHEQDRPRRLERRRDQALGRDDLEARAADRVRTGVAPR